MSRHAELPVQQFFVGAPPDFLRIAKISNHLRWHRFFGNNNYAARFMLQDGACH